MVSVCTCFQTPGVGEKRGWSTGRRAGLEIRDPAALEMRCCDWPPAIDDREGLFVLSSN